MIDVFPDQDICGRRVYLNSVHYTIVTHSSQLLKDKKRGRADDH